ncbi:MAG: S9 family peptidase [Terracidiphilus sp.]|nr:S9 family peptidase [Terracidiphilus sp.]
MRIPFVPALAAALLWATPVASTAQTAPTPHVDSSHIEQVLASLHRGRRIGAVAVSPDGKRVAWVEDGRNGSLEVSPIEHLEKGRPQTLSEAGQFCGASQPVWTPDSAAIVFLSDCAAPGEQQDFYLDRIDRQPARRISSLHGEADLPVIAPDGRSIAFLYVPGATRPAGALAAMKSPSGVIGEDGVEVQRVATVPLGLSVPSEPTIATPAGLHIYEFDWSPNSKSLAYVAAEPPGENNWWVAKLFTQKLGGEPQAILAPATIAGPFHGLQMAVPRWSPDAKSIAFIGGLMSDQGVTGGDLWLVSATGGQPANLTPGRPSSIRWFTWGAADHLWATDMKGGKLFLSSFQLTGNSSAPTAAEDRPPFPLPGTVSANSLGLSLSSTADRSRFVFRASSYEHAPEIVAVEPETAQKGDFNLRALSHFNDGIEPAWGKSASLDWTSDGFHVQGWLLEPKDFDPAKKYPMVVIVHGGPSFAETSRWGGGGLSPAAFSVLGYFVLLPNPRGSFGQGEAFTQANRKDFGYGDLRDIVAGVDAVVAKYPVDPNRVGLTGWSYGGFMTMFAVTQTHRFRAAVAGAGISNWQSYYGENSIDQWMIPFFGASVYDDPAVYAKSSAINYIKQAQTPTLVVVGDRDGECPAPQSFEFWHALRDRHVPSQLVVYPNEGHGLSNPAHARDVLERSIDWFTRYMPPAQ